MATELDLTLVSGPDSEETLNHTQKHLTEIWQGHSSCIGSLSLHYRELTRNVFLCILLYHILVSRISWRE